MCVFASVWGGEARWRTPATARAPRRPWPAPAAPRRSRSKKRAGRFSPKNMMLGFTILRAGGGWGGRPCARAGALARRGAAARRARARGRRRAPRGARARRSRRSGRCRRRRRRPSRGPASAPGRSRCTRRLRRRRGGAGRGGAGRAPRVKPGCAAPPRGLAVGAARGHTTSPGAPAQRTVKIAVRGDDLLRWQPRLPLGCLQGRVGFGRGLITD